MKFAFWMGRAGALLGLLLGSALLHAEPNTIDFTDKGSGFQDGSLKGQHSLSVGTQAPGNGDFVYVSGTGVLLKENRGGDHGSAFLYSTGTDSPEGRDTFDAGMAQSIAINFILTESGSTAKKSIVGLGWGIFIPVGPNCLPFHLAFMRDTEAGGYKLKIITDGKTQVEDEPFAAIPASALGLDPAKGKMTSDPLQLSLTLTNESDKTEWSSVGQLTNLTTHAVFKLKSRMTKAGYYKLGNLIRTVVNARRLDDDGLSSVVITKLDPEVTPAP